MRMLILSLLVTVAVLPLGSQAVAGDVAALCDRFAASPNDRDLGAAGIPLGQVDGLKAKEACEPALAADPMNARLAFQLGRTEEKLGNYKRARQLLEQASAGGYALADIELGIFHEDALGGLEQDYAKAMQSYLKASAAGYAVADNNIAVLYENGLGVSADPAKALEWYRKAAAADYISAVGNLAWLLEHNPDLSKDPSEMVEAYKRAAAAGIDYALTRLGVFYRDGLFGVEQDAGKAVAAFEAAAEKGDGWAELYLAQVLLSPYPGVANAVRAQDILQSLSDNDDAALRAEVLVTRAMAVLRNGGTRAEARDLVRQAIEADPDSAAVHAARAEVLRRESDLHAADDALAEAIAVDPGFKPFYVARQSVLRELGRDEEAAALGKDMEHARYGAFFAGL
ncbi:SEL1-like repeat protein [Ciceribacter sp. L1K23]|uniref:tetratricopeptide repeat protein n=1 Tax=Ciceribacter sp. L1K23 TaxID=2820276 RepID=UPI001B80F5DC|nr:SEL1-like repeat protein [Ciceribacter sp. L1K23]MBR0556268.1 SEL1-like repeat protein [Ciceribacter sp. L1K23]